MRKLILAGVMGVLMAVAMPAWNGVAQEKPVAYEYAVVKWDGPDRIYYNLPDKFELVYLEKTGVKIPKEAQAEEYCLAVASNKMAKEGWEAITLNSRRVMFRRVAK